MVAQEFRTFVIQCIIRGIIVLVAILFFVINVYRHNKKDEEEIRSFTDIDIHILTSVVWQKPVIRKLNLLMFL